MTALNTFNELLEAWETSTIAYNRFGEKLRSIDWEDKFYADGEYYFIVNDLTFTTPVINPFEPHEWVPTMITADGSFLSF